MDTIGVANLIAYRCDVKRDATQDAIELRGRGLSLPNDVRSRPGMFVGDTDAGGVAELVVQLLDNALDQHLSGQVSRVEVEIHDDHFCVIDDGPGLAATDVVPTSTGAAQALAPSARLGLGLVNSLAARLEIVTCRYGARRRWLFENFELRVNGERLEPGGERLEPGGERLGPGGERLGPGGERLGSGDEPGTCVRVWPDPSLFAAVQPDRFVLEQRLLGIHRVRPSLRVLLDGQSFDEPAGTESWVAGQRCCRGLEVHHIEARRGTTELDMAWAWLPPFGSAHCSSYVNLEETSEDGSHVDGLLEGLAQAHGVPLALARERTLALISVVAINPRFAGASRSRLHDPALARWIADLVVAHTNGR